MSNVPSKSQLLICQSDDSTIKTKAGPHTLPFSSSGARPSAS